MHKDVCAHSTDYYIIHEEMRDKAQKEVKLNWFL